MPPRGKINEDTGEELGKFFNAIVAIDLQTFVGEIGRSPDMTTEMRSVAFSKTEKDNERRLISIDIIARCNS